MIASDQNNDGTNNNRQISICIVLFWNQADFAAICSQSAKYTLYVDFEEEEEEEWAKKRRTLFHSCDGRYEVQVQCECEYTTYTVLIMDLLLLLMSELLWK